MCVRVGVFMCAAFHFYHWRYGWKSVNASCKYRFMCPCANKSGDVDKKQAATKSRNKNAINFLKVDTVVSCYQHLWSTTLKCTYNTSLVQGMNSNNADNVDESSWNWVVEKEKMHLWSKTTHSKWNRVELHENVRVNEHLFRLRNENSIRFL